MLNIVSNCGVGAQNEIREQIVAAGGRSAPGAGSRADSERLRSHRNPSSLHVFRTRVDVDDDDDDGDD